MAIRKPTVRKPLPPVQPPVEPREELPLITEEVAPPEIPEEELPPIEGDIFPLLKDIYPEMFEPGAYYGYTAEEVPEMVLGNILSWAGDDPSGFLADLYERDGTGRGEQLLEMMGVTPEEISEISTAFADIEAREIRAAETLEAVFPDLTPEELIEFATDNWDLFLSSIQYKGLTKETQDLLLLMGFSRPEIVEIFGIQRIILDIEGVHRLVIITPQNEVLDEEGRQIGTYNLTTGEYEPYQYWLGDTWLHFSAGVGDVIATAGGALTWLGAEGMGENLSEFGEFLQLQAPPDTLGEFEWSHLLNPRFYATRVVRTLPFTMSLIPAMIAGKYAGLFVAAKIGLGKFGTFLLECLGAGVFSRTIESALEAGGTYDRAIEKGLSEAEAREAANSVFLNNLKLVGVDAAQLAVAFAPIHMRIFNSLIARGLVTTARVGGRLTITGLSEAGEEWYQEIIQRVALGEDVVWDAEMKEVCAIGGIIGIGLGAAGEVWTSIMDKTQGAMTPAMRARFDADKAGFMEQGFTDEQAALKALDIFAETEEGQAIIKNIVESEKVDALETEIKPKTEAERVVWEQTIAKMREEITPIPEVAPPVREIPRQLSLEEISALETRFPIEKMWVDEKAYLDRLTAEIEVEGITEPVTIRVREDGSMIVWDGIHRLVVAQKLEIQTIPVTFIGEVEKLPALKPPAVEVAPRAIEEIEGREATAQEKSLRQQIWITVKKKNISSEVARGIFEEATGKRFARAMTVAELTDTLRAIRAFKIEPEVAKPPVAPEVMAERAITSEQTETLNTLAKEKLIMTEEGKTKPQLRRLMQALTGKNRINQLTQAEADVVIDAVGRLEVKYGRPPVIPTGVGLITAEFADKIPLLKEIGILEKVRPTRHVFEKMGLRQEVWKPAFEAEVRVYEEHQAFDKELGEIGKLVGKDPARRRLVFRELENPGSQVGLTFNEKRAVAWFRRYFNKWADRLNLPESKRRANYVTHLFEQEISQQLKDKHPLDPELIKALDFITPKTVFNPYLQKRLGQTIGLREDPFAAATAYEARALKVFYYEPLIQRIRVYQKYLPPRSARYLGDFINRITDRPSNIDKAMNHTIKEFADRIRGLPGGETFANFLTRGNPSGMASYNLTSALYTLWLGYKPTSAIRNLGQHTLILAEVGPKHFANAIRLRGTQEGRAALRESLVLRSRRGAFIPAIDSSFASKWIDSFREKALWMFRGADKQNVSDAFLGGYSEAKELFPNAPRELWIARGDEVAADTQYLYTLLNSFQMSQNSIGRVFSMLTTWTENWIELMVKWITARPSQVYLAYTKETGQAMPKKNWSQTRRAILMYMLIIGLGYALKEKTRLKAWEYTGLTSLSYLADIVGGDFPALQAPGAVADLIVGFVTDDDRRLTAGWNGLRSTFIPSIIKQMNYVATGERDWLTLLLYLEGQDIQIKRLRDDWEKEFEAYPLFKDKDGEYDPDLKFEYLKEHPEQIGWSDAKIRNQWRIDNPKIEAKMFIVGKFTTLSTDEARAEVLRLIEEHNIDTELIDGYEKVFGVNTKSELQEFQDRLGNLEKLVVGEEAEYFTTSNFATEVNALVKTMGRARVEQDGHRLAIEYLHAQDLWEPYYNLEEDEARILWRRQFPDVEALLYLFGKISSLKNPQSAEILLGLMKKYNIPPEAIRAFIDDPARYDELFTPIFELKQKIYDLSTEYENYGNSESPIYIEDKDARAEARDKLRADNPGWVANLRRIEAYENDASEDIVEKWVDRGVTIDEFGAGSSQAKVWLIDNPEVHKWALDNKLLTDDGSDWNENILRINVEMEGLDPGSDEYRRLNYKKNAHGNDFPEELIDTYTDYYMMPPKPEDYEDINKTDLWLEDDWYLIEHPDFYKAMVEKGLMQERDFSKIPTRAVFDKYLEYLQLTKGKRRDDYRWENQDLDAWLVIKFNMVPITEKRRRLELTPTEEFLEDVAEKEAEFDEAMRELEELLEGLR